MMTTPALPPSANQAPANQTPANQMLARWDDLKVRILSAVVLAPLALGCIWIGGAAFTGLVALITIGLSHEWLVLCRQPIASAAAVLFAALPLAVVLTAWGGTMTALLLLAIATGVGTAMAGGLSPARPLIFGIPYFGLGAVALVWLRQSAGAGGVNVIVLLLIVWASDIGAYIVGRAVGGPRLAPAISPGKTWSGAVGGLAAAAAIGLAAPAFLANELPSWRSVGIAVFIGLISQAGDLFESQLKRHFGVKDSGNTIPGHGGILDRLDAVLTAAPAAALLAMVLGPGVVLWE